MRVDRKSRDVSYPRCPNQPYSRFSFAIQPYTLKALSLALCPHIHMLALDEPRRADHRPRIKQSVLLPHSKLCNMLLWGNSTLGEMSQHRLGHVPRIANPATDLHSIVPVYVDRLDAHHL